MNQEILFATHNKGKLKEARAFLSKVGYVVYGLDDLFLDEKVTESGSTYAENAYLKAQAFSTLPFPVFSDDSGFEIASLSGKPGLHSARFAEELGEQPTVISTGGLAKTITPHCRHKIINDEDLLLKGLWIIYSKNQ